MARYHQRDRICGASARDGSPSLWTAELPGDFRVRARLAVRNPLQGIPDATLKCSPINIKWHIQRRIFSREMLHNLTYPSGNLRVIPRNLGFRILTAQA